MNDSLFYGNIGAVFMVISYFYLHGIGLVLIFAILLTQTKHSKSTFQSPPLVD